MAEAKRDQNRVTTVIGVSSVDLKTPTNIAVDPITNEVLTQPGQLLPTAGHNASAVYTYTSSNLTKITKTINGTDYEKTFTYDGSNNLTASSVWSEV